MRKLHYGISIMILGFILSAWGFSKSSVPSPAEQIKVFDLICFNDFKLEVDTLASFAAQQDEADINALRSQIKETRLAYKKIEFFFDYLHTKFSYLNINGGPLMKLDEDNTHQDPIKPNGLQALDELIFSDEAGEEILLIDSLAQALQAAVKLVQPSHEAARFQDQMIIEAMRSGLIRIFTLGVTGFDTPGSGNAIEEATMSLAAMDQAFALYEKSLTPKAESTYFTIRQLFVGGIQQLEESDFENFDRLTFLRKVINPLYAALRTFSIESDFSQKLNKTHAHNYETSNLLDKDFLDRNYFQELSYADLRDPARVELGKLLFFDPILSKDIKMSCASCHSPDKAFSDGLATSRTNKPGKSTLRNSPSLIDATFSKKYFHDLRSANLERQIPHVFENEDEFNLSFTEVIQRLNQSEVYKQLFGKAYAGIATRDDINQRSISNALAAYVNTLVSMDSEFDQYIREERTDYPQEAQRGFNLFMGKAACGTCHFAPVFNGTVPPFYIDSESEVLGVTVGLDTINPVLDPDPGRYENGVRSDKWPHFKNSFKTPGLRNISLTAPYMHNGSFETLDEVMEFYNKGGGAGMGLAIDNQTLAPDPLDLSQGEVRDIISFLHTLQDTSGLHPGKVSLPHFESKPEWNNREINSQL